MAGPPRVSVCIPTYNYAEFIGAAIESVLGQTFTDFELIVSDDASSDDTESFVNRYAEDQRLSFVRNESNLGMFANFNTAAGRARGEFVKFLCADDWLAPECLERACALLESSPGASMLTCANWLCDANGAVIGLQRPPFGPSGVVPRAAAVRQMARWLNVIGMPSNVLLRRAAFESSGGFDANYAPAGDVHLWLRLLQQGDLAWIDEPLAYARVHDRHSHVYGTDPSDAPFRCWLDARAWSESNVDDDVLRAALDAEAERNMLHAAADLLLLRFTHAREIYSYTRRYVKPARFVGRFVARLPLLAYDQLCRLVGIALGRRIDYRPRPRIGERRTG